MKNQEIAALYQAHTNGENLNAIADLTNLLTSKPVYFDKYFENTEGQYPKQNSNHNSQGTFIDFASGSKQYQYGELVEVDLKNIGTVYVQLSDIELI